MIWQTTTKQLHVKSLKNCGYTFALLKGLNRTNFCALKSAVTARKYFNTTSMFKMFRKLRGGESGPPEIVVCAEKDMKDGE